MILGVVLRYYISGPWHYTQQDVKNYALVSYFICLLIRNHPVEVNHVVTVVRIRHMEHWPHSFVQDWPAFAPEVSEHGMNACVVPQADLRAPHSENERQTGSHLFEMII